MQLDDLLEKALEATEKEIEAVLEKPAKDVLHQGIVVHSKLSDEYHYEFESNNKALRFAEVFKATINGKSYESGLVDFKDETVILSFPEDQGKKIAEVELEWENDFILRKVEAELFRLKSGVSKKEKEFITALFSPNEIDAVGELINEAYADGQRNPAQNEAVEKAINNKVTYIWGPPGTGKTSTLGYIIANYLLYDKKVLFASNTNRAVDVGTLSVTDALDKLGEKNRFKDISRFGEVVLENQLLNDILFDNQIEKKSRQQKEKAAQLQQTLSEYRKLQGEAEKLLNDGQSLPGELDTRLEMLADKVDQYGGEAALEDRIDSMIHVNELIELDRKKLVCTTLARVCTSDLFNDLKFDAVVIDEASMANLPYLLVLASKAAGHIVVVGDPMQLPPIATTNDFKAKDFLEMDIFAFVSGAKTTEDLFRWHDENPGFTSFFDTQYRLNEDLADVISKVFYEGRLKTVKPDKKNRKTKNGNNRSIAVYDSSPYNPVLTKKSSDRGFQPLNEVHMRLIQEMVKKLVTQLLVPQKEIGIMVPFRSTVYDLRGYLWKAGFREVEVGTIHTFQGREKQVIIFDTVMSGEMQNGRKRHYSVRPFDEKKNGLSVPRLLNVAFSRSRDKLVVIADMEHIEKIYRKKFLGRLIAEMQNYSNGSDESVRS
ncbi:MAG TPA: AAA domain-containing protein [Balneolales bacterium]|nr:AAA domain-containing protein [Balneolales bacterium]